MKKKLTFKEILLDTVCPQSQPEIASIGTKEIITFINNYLIKDAHRIIVSVQLL